MALETGTDVGDLTPANPTASDPKSQGDDHLRLIKTALRQSFAGWTKAIIVTGTNGGAVNAYTLSPTTALLAYTSPMLVVFIPSVTNTGAATINISALGAKSLKSVSGAALTSGELVAGCVYVAAYDGTNFNLVAPTKAYIDQLAFQNALPDQAGHASSYPRTDGTNVTWSLFSATAAQVFAGSATDSALTPGNATTAIAEVSLYINGSSQVVTGSAAGTTLDLSSGINFLLTGATGALTLPAPSAVVARRGGSIRIVWSGSGSITLNSAYKRSGGSVTFSGTNGATDFFDYDPISTSYVRYDVSLNPS